MSTCVSPSKKCAFPKKCPTMNGGKGGCIMAVKGKSKPGQVTGKSGGY